MEDCSRLKLGVGWLSDTQRLSMNFFLKIGNNRRCATCACGVSFLAVEL